VVTVGPVYLSFVNFFEVALVYAGIPLVVIIAIGLLTVVRSRAKARPKYRPGASWDYSDRLFVGDTPLSLPSHVSDSPVGGARGTW
jgi:hypothetical protein